MGTHYTHVTWREWLKIETRLKDGWGEQQIADELRRYVSTIYREEKCGLGIQRTTDLIDKECYISEIAQTKEEKTKPRAARNCKGKSTEKRPKEVDDRETLGHWEMDTVSKRLL